MTGNADQPLLRTPLYDNHVALGARMTGFGGWDMPLSYAGQLSEHRAVRNATGLFDVSHMGQVRFRGPNALEYLQWLVPGDIASLSIGQSRYTQLVTEFGGIVDDLIISRTGPEEYFAVVNASTREGDVAWMKQQAKGHGYGTVDIIDESAKWGMIAVQGPQVFTVLESVLGKNSGKDSAAFTLQPFIADGQPHLLSRTGYTGETGAELLCPAALTSMWWERFLAAGAVPCGLAARDSLRLEAGYCLYGQDLDRTTSPVEAGLSWSVGWKKDSEFIGRRILEKQKAEGASRKLVALRAIGRKPLRHGDVVMQGESQVGIVTSGGYSPGLEAGIALAYVSTAALTGGALIVQTKTAAIPVMITKPPFVPTSLKK